jgi:FkbM family methyltransferase
MERPPFGHYNLAPWRETLRRLAGIERSGSLRRIIASLARRAAIAGHPDPFDLEVFEGQKVRLYPRDNLCEKRVFVNAETWDRQERASIRQMIEAGDRARPFRFVDAGAYVGLYSLFVYGAAQAVGRPVEILAIEPDPVNRQRLAYNIETSGAAGSARIVDKALGDGRQQGHLVFEGDNRGRIRLAGAGEGSSAGGVAVEIAPLAEVLRNAGLDGADLLKIDIEGGESAVLAAFFAGSGRDAYPRAIILETISATGGDALSACLEAGYRPRLQTRMNSVLVLDEEGGTDKTLGPTNRQSET